ncbi:DUF1932 domain-containing protein [Streptomyces boninensis]|uniref:NAD(P)-dependent oxidoreductase n=1 Tax=Streptomyces boninensis TaxID=2039455 RepID=UPI003B220F13
MGAAVAAQARRQGTEVLWCPAGRSAASKERAEQHGLTAVSDLAAMTERVDVILSICPPANAVEVADAVAGLHFSGIYVDGNAVSPETVARIGDVVSTAGATVVDGAVVGSPPSDSKRARLYLSGPAAALTEVAEIFADSAVHTHLLEGGLGRASALKLSYSSYQKTSRVLVGVAYALATEYGVEDELLDIAQGRTNSYLSETDYVPKTAARAWRWSPELREAASALAAVNLPPDLVEAAARVMGHWATAKDRSMNMREALDLLHDRSE